MTLGAACPNCRKPMTWVPTSQQWACAPCNAMFAAQPVMLPAFPMAMQPKKSKLPLVVGGVAVVGAVIAIAVIASHHKQSKPMLADEPAAAPPPPPPPKVETPNPAPRPIPPSAPTPIAKFPDAMTLDHPEPLGLADFWVWHREDGASAIRSQLLEVAFPHKPIGSFDHGWVMTDDLAGRGLLSLTVIAGYTEAKAFTVETVKKELAVLGPVTDIHRTDRGTEVYRYDAKGAAENGRTEVRVDTARGLVLIARAKIIASDAPFAEAFFDSVHLRPPAVEGALDNEAKVLTVRSRMAKGKYQAHDAQERFTIDFPWKPKVDRTTERHNVDVNVISGKGRASASLRIQQLIAEEALMASPEYRSSFVEAERESSSKLYGTAKVAQETLGGLPATRVDAKGKGHSVHTHWLWNFMQHRVYVLSCTDAPCDQIALSLAFPQAPVPVQ